MFPSYAHGYAHSCSHRLLGQHVDLEATEGQTTTTAILEWCGTLALLVSELTQGAGCGHSRRMWAKCMGHGCIAEPTQTKIYVVSDEETFVQILICTHKRNSNWLFCTFAWSTTLFVLEIDQVLCVCISLPTGQYVQTIGMHRFHFHCTLMD